VISLLDQLRLDLYGEGYDIASFKVSAMVGTSLPTSSQKIPHVKAVAKVYADNPDFDPKSIPLSESVELTLVYFWIVLKRCSSFGEQMSFLDQKLGYANFWMITDGLPQQIKKVPASEFLPYYRKWVASKEEYCKRFAYVEAMSHYRESITPFLKGLRPDKSYYVTMSQAWMLATFAIPHFQEVVAFLEKDKLPLLLKRKTISKMVDSYRISPEEKEIVKKLRAQF
jgi:hypothetical protein